MKGGTTKNNRIKTNNSMYESNFLTKNNTNKITNKYKETTKKYWEPYKLNKIKLLLATEEYTNNNQKSEINNKLITTKNKPKYTNIYINDKETEFNNHNNQKTENFCNLKTNIFPTIPNFTLTTITQ